MSVTSGPLDPAHSLDVMNDPAYDPGAEMRREKSMDDPDTCRICRSEASIEEALFYPCKCSGSIKFVHQNCLMEWLSHSQKKHCELCKTPFRFTKLYHPHMPPSVPPLVFLRQVIIHTWRSLISWSRFHLVAFVWLGWLPWTMRTVWRGLFWIGDGGWINWAYMEEEAKAAAKYRNDNLAANGTSPAPQMFLLPSNSTSAVFVSRLARKLPEVFSPTLSVTQSIPYIFGLYRSLFVSLLGGNEGNGTTPNPDLAGLDRNAHNVPAPYYSQSWLSEVGALRTLTRWPIFNNVVIDTFEGWLITLLIVVVFVVTFLIREWVVQQQPLIVNFPAANNQAPLPAIEQGPLQNDADLENPIIQDDLPVINDDLPNVPDDTPNEEPRPLAAASTQQDEPLVLAQDDSTDLAALHEDETGLPENVPSDAGDNSEERMLRLLEDPSGLQLPDPPNPGVFLDIWRRANHDPRELLRIINEEGRSEELKWIVAAIREMESHAGRSDVNRVQAGQDPSEPPPDLAHDQNSTSNGKDCLYNLDNVSNDTERESLMQSINPEENVNADRSGSTESQSTSPLIVEDGASAFEASAQRRMLDDITETNPFRPESARQCSSDQPTENLREAQPSGIGADTDRTAAERNESATTIHNETAQPDVPSNASLLDSIAIWLWGEANPGGIGNNGQAAADDEHVVQDLANEAPFVPVANGQPQIGEHHPGAVDHEVLGHLQDVEVGEEAFQIGVEHNDAEGVEEVDEFEGILELMGMQGPIAGLIQNGMFCAILVALTILLAVWIPYIMGKIFLVFLANPVSLLFHMPFRWISGTADLVTDTIIFTVTCAYYWLATAIQFLCLPVRKMGYVSKILYGEEVLAEAAKGYAERSLGRLTQSFLVTADSLSDSDIPAFSIIAHASLKSFQHGVSRILQVLVSAATTVCTYQLVLSPGGSYRDLLASKWEIFRDAGVEAMAGIVTKLPMAKSQLYEASTSLVSTLSFNLGSIDGATSPNTYSLDHTLIYWNAKDRVLAILFGYLFIALLGLLYLRLSLALKTNKTTKVEGPLADLLYQAGGVAKVILIISIEMIAFPLYCGLLLDVALLPMFRNVTFLSRLEFMVDSPCTSLFIHWFVGTCYMFHFALFVSMCRKIMRTGVLYFIRDPDDPTFHPVRDVLERNVFGQLGKIAFSAMVYGGLVLVCLGGVIWGIWTAFDGVFPICWSSNEPVLEFPADLLFYYFLTPLAMRVFRPAVKLTAMYSWWFERCAQWLRLSHFLFGVKREEEEGHHVRRTWRAFFSGKEGDVKNPVIGKERQQLAEDRGLDAYFLRDGCHVRTPASDQVRIPKGSSTFVEVDQDGNRVDGQSDDAQGLHGRDNAHFATIYIPPHFRLRIGAFILLLWLFAASTGVCVTVIPLIFGRRVFSTIFPAHPRMNDIYAFSFGIGILGGATFALLNARTGFEYCQTRIRAKARSSNALRGVRIAVSYAARLLRVLYTYFAFVILLPSLLTLLNEVYFVIPLHTFFGAGPADRHTVYLIQNWVLGVLTVKTLGHLILWHSPSRPASALRNIIHRGWTDPDVRVATRGFILPSVVVTSVLLLAPLGLGWVTNAVYYHDASDARKSAVYRYSYPGVLALALDAVAVHYLRLAFQSWKKRIRDEVYLIGERLHNYGERKMAGSTTATRGAARVGT
ncbi:MAG: hypothetical protein Q9174_003066 [Haloplaca sp. 1 TL-2023]